MLENQIPRVPRKHSCQASPLGLFDRLLPAACRVSVAVVATTLLLLGASSSYALVQIGQTFDTSLGNWGATIPNYGSNVNYAINWNNSANASISTPGELLFQSTRLSVGSPTPLSMPRVLDTASFAGGNTLNLNSPLSVSGQMYFGPYTAADTTLHVGYFDSSIADPSQERLMLRIVGPSSGRWRFQFGGPGGNSGTRATVPDTTWQATSLSFQFNWVPSGLNDGSGVLSGTVRNGGTIFTVPSYNIAANTAVFDSFGIWADSSSSTILANQQIQYFDNIQYTVVPEPSVGLLLPLGAGLLLLTQRALRRK